jgi:hypothetical protein
MGRMEYTLMGGKPGQQEPYKQATGVPHKDGSRVKIIEEKAQKGPHEKSHDQQLPIHVPTSKVQQGNEGQEE